MTTYRAITRVRTDGALFLPGEEVWGLSEPEAVILLAAGGIESVESKAAPKNKTPKKDKASPLTPRTTSA